MRTIKFRLAITSFIGTFTCSVCLADEPREQPLSAEAEAAVSHLRDTLPPDSEGIAMLEAILAGSRMGPGSGWFAKAHSQTRYDWTWFSESYDQDKNDSVSLEESHLDPVDFARVDRDNNGQITTADFDWDEDLLRDNRGRSIFLQGDRDSNGKLTREEFIALYDSIAGSDSDFISMDELGREFRPPTTISNQRSEAGPDRNTLVLGLKNQEIGSLQAGPALNEEAPDFTLRALSGEEVNLNATVQDKPTVLIFGNFTCGPFRSQSGNITKLVERYRDRVNFLMVYVREAHPEDGWNMSRNRRVGIEIQQPNSDTARREVAASCQAKLDLPIPFLVDGVDDAVGATYSGMPNRLYLIDQDRKVAFKNGRGPFGFSIPQLEQAMVLLLNK